MKNKITLYNPQAEVEVLSACIFNPYVLEYVRELLSDDLFSDYKCIKAYQIIKQLDKMHDVKQVQVMERDETVTRELLLIKIKNDSSTRQDVLSAVDVFRSKIVDYSPALSDDGITMNYDISPDGIHPSAEGYRRMVKELKKVVNFD